jgi:hypothetical protein
MMAAISSARPWDQGALNGPQQRVAAAVSSARPWVPGEAWSAPPGARSFRATAAIASRTQAAGEAGIGPGRIAECNPLNSMDQSKAP